MQDDIPTESSDTGQAGAPQYRLLLKARRPSEVFRRERTQVQAPPEPIDEARTGPEPDGEGRT